MAQYPTLDDFLQHFDQNLSKLKRELDGTNAALGLVSEVLADIIEEEDADNLLKSLEAIEPPCNGTRGVKLAIAAVHASLRKRRTEGSGPNLRLISGADYDPQKD